MEAAAVACLLWLGAMSRGLVGQVVTEVAGATTLGALAAGCARRLVTARAKGCPCSNQYTGAH
jgi:hypothetical protein